MPKTVILIDDDRDDLELLLYVFKKVDSGIHCIPFDNPVTAIKELCHDEFPVPHCIFMDINMPLMSGHECLLQIRGIRGFEKIPIVMISTSMPDVAANKLKNNGATFAFEKPIGLNGYVDIVKNLSLW